MMKQQQTKLGVLEGSFLTTADGEGYKNFHTCNGVHGLAKHDDDRLDILSVKTDQPGTGQFKAFIVEQQKNFCFIYIWEIRNPILPEILKRYGFTPCVETIDGKVWAGMEWAMPF